MPADGDMSQLKLPLPLEAAVDGPFVIGASNRAAVDALAAWPSGDERVLALAGPAGSGKSRLAAIWAERVGAVSAHGAEAALIDPLELEGRPVLIDRACDADDETLFHLINLAQSGAGALLLTCREEPRAWDTTLPDLRSRLDAIRVIRIEAPDDEVMAALLRARFAERLIAPPDDVIAYLVRRLDRSASEIEAAVERLDAAHRPVTRALARQVLAYEL